MKSYYKGGGWGLTSHMPTLKRGKRQEVQIAVRDSSTRQRDFWPERDVEH